MEDILPTSASKSVQSSTSYLSSSTSSSEMFNSIQYTFIHFTQVEHYKYLNTIFGGGIIGLQAWLTTSASCRRGGGPWRWSCPSSPSCQGCSAWLTVNVFRQHNLLKAPPACVPSEDKVVTIVNGGGQSPLDQNLMLYCAWHLGCACML